MHGIITSNRLANASRGLVSGFPVCFSHKIPGYVQVKNVIFPVIVQTILAPKGRHQRHSKLAVVQNMENIVSILY